MSARLKTCKACGSVKALDEFYFQHGASDGHMGKCKECWKAQVKARARTNPAVQAYDRARAKRPARVAHARAITIQWRKDHPVAYRAQTAVGNALRDGRLFRGPCETCGSTDDIHGHHDDYSKPLDVRWLCALHHHRHHADVGSAFA